MERSSFQIVETHANIFRLGIAVAGAHEIVVVTHRLLSWERNILKIIKGAGTKFFKFEWGNAYSLSASCKVSWTFRVQAF